jgi:hypothetical protein
MGVQSDPPVKLTPTPIDFKELPVPSRRGFFLLLLTAGDSLSADRLLTLRPLSSPMLESSSSSASQEVATVRNISRVATTMIKGSITTYQRHDGHGCRLVP